MPEIPKSLQGLRVRLISPASENSAPIEQTAYTKLKALLAEHGQHIRKKTLALFRQSLNGLLLHGLRAIPIETPDAGSDGARVRFKASDGRIYEAPSKAWGAILKADPGAKKYPSSRKISSQSEQTSARREQKPPKKRSLADALFDSVATTREDYRKAEVLKQ